MSGRNNPTGSRENDGNAHMNVRGFPTPDIRYLSSFLAKALIVTFGLMVASMGVVFYLKAGLGVDAFTVFYGGVSRTFHLSIGAALQICLFFLIVVIFFVDRTQLGAGTLMHAFLMGFFIDGILGSNFIPGATSTSGAVIFLIAAIALVGVGLGIYIKGGLGVGAIDATMLILHGRIRKDIKWIRIGIDFLLASFGFLLGGTLGVGTIAGILLTGPTIEITLRTLDSVFPNTVKIG